MSEELKAFKNRLQTLRKKYPAYNHFFDFYAGVILTRRGFQKSPRVKVPAIEKQMLDLMIKEGFPLLSPDNFSLDVNQAQELFFRLCKSLKEVPETKAKAERIESYFKDHREDLAQIFNHFLEKKYSTPDALDEYLLHFVLFHSLKPSLRACAEALAPSLEQVSWNNGYCPICGHYPHIAALKEDGKRFLKCSFCEYEWQIERVFCPFCGEKDYKKLKYLEAEGEEAYRVYLCEACKSYLKTVDERLLPDVADLELEDIATIHLDILAEKEGYKKLI